MTQKLSLALHATRPGLAVPGKVAPAPAPRRAASAPAAVAPTAPVTAVQEVAAILECVPTQDAVVKAATSVKRDLAVAKAFAKSLASMLAIDVNVDKIDDAQVAKAAKAIAKIMARAKPEFGAASLEYEAKIAHVIASKSTKAHDVTRLEAMQILAERASA